VRSLLDSDGAEIVGLDFGEWLCGCKGDLLGMEVGEEVVGIAEEVESVEYPVEWAAEVGGDAFGAAGVELEEAGKLGGLFNGGQVGPLDVLGQADGCGG